MAFRAATSKVKVPASAMRLFSLLEGLPEDAPRSLGLSDRFRRRAVMRLTGTSGVGSDYLFGEFLEGAEHALRRAAALEPPSRSPRDVLSEEVQALLGARALQLKAKDMRLTWDIEDVTDSSLGEVRVVLGVRRGEPIDHANMFKVDRGYCCFVASRKDTRDSGLSRWLRNSTLSVEALIKCRQSVTLSTAAGDIVAHSFSSEAYHALRLEAELGFLNVGGGKFDEECAWIVTDLNRALGGNCVAAGIKEIGTE